MTTPLIDADYFEANMTQLGLKEKFAPQGEALDQLILDASEWVESYLRRVVAATDITEVVKGKGYNRLILDQWPVNTVTSIVYDDDGGASGTIDVSNIRPLYNGMIEWKHPYSHGPWRSTRTYTVEYNAGYDPIPANLKRATALKVVDLFSPQYQGARDQRSIEQVTKLEELLVDLLEPYRRERLG